ncbi:MAG: glyoxalase [Lachnospiraceae bacterium]|jgi:catechol 2,3-dioxygenase-like lactoylglutathione lyase family enzyme|nr:glyoxalase [Lachnospiraceae bacterium]MCI9100186.1 glyoxalase [Lachnospiraceae bacterium]MCI9357536.1 glyoxalase [Lachnospiraceae bacterium]
MKLKNILIVVEDIERSRKFYHDLFGLEMTADFDGNMILTEGLVLQEKKIWETLIGRPSVCGDSDAELYFEENNLDDFMEKLEAYSEPVRYLNPLMEHHWGQRVIRIYDPDGHVIEVGEAMDYVIKRFYEAGMSLEAIAQKTQFPVEQVAGICGCG